MNQLSETSQPRHIQDYLAAHWDDLSSDGQRRALALGRAREASVRATVASVGNWDEWIQGEPGNEASWPSYELSVSVGGELVGDVTGWVVYDLDGGSWEHSDGACNGLPRTECDDPRTVNSGDNVGDTLELPTYADDGAVLIYDEYRVDCALRDAADCVSIDGPGVSDLPDAVEEYETVGEPRWFVEDSTLHVRRCIEHTRYGVTGYAVVEAELNGEVKDTWHSRMPSSCRGCGYGPDLLTAWHDSASEAWDSCGNEMHESPLSSSPEALAALDALVERTDPLVTFEDSLKAGNCRVGTEQFVREHGELLASDLLAIRDDQYTRAACRQAVLREVHS